MSKKIIGIVILIIFGVVVYNLIFSETSLEKQLKENLPYDLVTYKLSDDNDTEYTLSLKELKIEKYTKEGNYAQADATIILEDENLKKTMFVTLYCTKYNTSWQVDSWNENEDALVVPKYAPSEYSTEDEAATGGFFNLSMISETTDYSNGLFSRTYTVNDKYEYVSFTGEITVNAEFIEYDGTELYSYYWDLSAEKNIKTEWNVTGTWNLEYNFASYTPKYTAIINIYDISDDENISGDATRYYPKNDGINYTGEYGTEYDDSLYCEKNDSSPSVAKLEIYSSCGSIEFTADSCVGYMGTGKSRKCQSVTLE